MTPGARVQAAIDVLDGWQSGLALEQALSRWARGARYAGSKDRAAVRDHVFHALRNKGRAAILGGGETGRALMIGALRLSDTDAALLFNGEGHAPSKLTGTESTPPDTSPGIFCDTPEWARQALGEGPDVEGLMGAFAHRAPVYLRVNLRKTDAETALTRLGDEGIAAEIDTRAATALRVTHGERRVQQSSAYQDGLVELQDLSVQRAVLDTPWPKTGRILDYCAGGGGKTLAVASLTAAELFAHDANPMRMSNLPARATRAGVAVTMLTGAELARHGPFDAVVCDVPCSGSGTWRRNPEAKWRMTPARLEALTEAQDAILAEAARLVSPGGLLVYMTCSLFDAENSARIEAFLTSHTGWSPRAAALDTPLTASDGFYRCELKRVERD